MPRVFYLLNAICLVGFITDDIVKPHTSEPTNMTLTPMENDEDSEEEIIRSPSKHDVTHFFVILNSDLNRYINTIDDHYKTLNGLESLFTETNKQKILHVQPKITEYMFYVNKHKTNSS